MRINKEHLELYTDYLFSTFGKATATGLSSLVNGQVSHDKLIQFLFDGEYLSKDLWQEVKPMVRKVGREDAVLIFDDTTQEKPYTDENAVMWWHYGHSKGRMVQGFNLLNCLYHVGDISILHIYFTMLELLLSRTHGNKLVIVVVSYNNNYNSFGTYGICVM